MMGSRGRITIQTRPSRQQLSRWLLQQLLATAKLGSMGRIMCTTTRRYGAPDIRACTGTHHMLRWRTSYAAIPRQEGAWQHEHVCVTSRKK